MRRTLSSLALWLVASMPASADVAPAAADRARGSAPAGAAAASSGGLPVAEVRELGVTLLQFSGLPADSAARGALLGAFHDEMDRRAIPVEKRTAAAWTPADTLESAFRLLEAAPPGVAWSLELSIRLPPEVRAERRAAPGSGHPPARARVSRVRSSRGLVVAATAHAPERSGRPVEPEPLVLSLYFPDARRVVVPSPNLPAGGYAYPWADAGRVVARAALEALHRASGLMAADERADLAPAARAENAP